MPTIDPPPGGEQHQKPEESDRCDPQSTLRVTAAILPCGKKCRHIRGDRCRAGQKIRERLPGRIPTDLMMPSLLPEIGLKYRKRKAFGRHQLADSDQRAIHERPDAAIDADGRPAGRKDKQESKSEITQSF